MTQDQSRKIHSNAMPRLEGGGSKRLCREWLKRGAREGEARAATRRSCGKFKLRSLSASGCRSLGEDESLQASKSKQAEGARMGERAMSKRESEAAMRRPGCDREAAMRRPGGGHEAAGKRP